MAAAGKTTYFEALREQHFLLEALLTVRVVEEEGQPAASLDTLTVTMPERYIRTTSGGWQCPPGESAAQVHGSVDRNMVYADGAIKLANVEGPNGLICQ